MDQCRQFQNDLNVFYEYCSQNELKLNIDKCHTITYSRKKLPLKYNYSFNGVLIERVFRVRDLGVYLDCELGLASHIDIVTSRAYKMLGFVFRQCKDFKNMATYIMLYNSLVRSHLEYASTVWNPLYTTYIEQLERIQNKFLRRLRYKFRNPAMELRTLQLRREHRDQVFLFKILNNVVDSPYLHNRIYYRCPRLTARSNAVFSVPTCKTNYSKNRFLVRACNIHNARYSSIDIFNCKLRTFVCAVRKIEGIT